jgi:hypothetical protein
VWHDVISLLSVFLAGILAGEEVVVRYGVHPSLATLDERSQIQARQGLIRTLRVQVPSVFAATAVSAVAALILDGTDDGLGFRVAGVLALLAWILVTAIGTVPINKGALEWQADAPPANWRALVVRWERLDVIRSCMAMLAFAFLLIAAVLAAATS